MTSLTPELDALRRAAEAEARLRKWSKGGRSPYLQTVNPGEALRDDVVAILDQLEASKGREARLEKALSFYADEARYHGPNQKRFANDEWSQGPYLQDVTRDKGDIARAALSHQEGGAG